MPYLDPVSAGISAFRGITDVFQSEQDRKMRRELMEREAADRSTRLQMEKELQPLKLERERMGTEREKLGIEQSKLAIEQAKKTIGLQNQLVDLIGKNPGLLDDFDSSLKKTQAISQGQKENFTDNEINSFFTLLPSIGHIDLDHLDEQTDAVNSFRNWLGGIGPQIIQNPQEKIKITREQAPEQFANFEKIYGDRIKTGTDQHGLNVDRDGVKKSLKEVLIDKSDPKMPTVSLVLDVESPVKEGQVFRHVGDQNPRFTVNPKANGLIEQGNIDLSKRPVVRNKDGSVSTVLSYSFGTEENGQEVEVVVPLVQDDGTIITGEEARAKYEKDGKHLGKFRTVADASRYAEELSKDPIWDQDKQKYSAKGQTSTKYTAPMTFDHGNDPNAEVVRLPLAFLDKQSEGMQKALNTYRLIAAQLHPEETLKRIEGLRQTRASNQAIAQARRELLDYQEKNPKASVNKLRGIFEARVLELNPNMDQKTVISLSKDIIPEKEEELELKRRELTFKEEDLKERRKATAAKEKATETNREERLKLEKGKAAETARHNKAVEAQKITEKEEKPLSVTEQREIEREAFGRYAPLVGEDVDDREGILKRRNLDELISSIPEEDQQKARDVVSRATELKQKDRKLTTRQALDTAEKEFGKIAKPKKELDEATAKAILKEAGGNKDKARKIATERGYKF